MTVQKKLFLRLSIRRAVVPLPVVPDHLTVTYRQQPPHQRPKAKDDTSATKTIVQ